jgi:hypothetical protein
LIEAEHAEHSGVQSVDMDSGNPFLASKSLLWLTEVAAPVIGMIGLNDTGSFVGSLSDSPGHNGCVTALLRAERYVIQWHCRRKADFTGLISPFAGAMG